jgi:hypothetical protein
MIGARARFKTRSFKNKTAIYRAFEILLGQGLHLHATHYTSFFKLFVMFLNVIILLLKNSYM